MDKEINKFEELVKILADVVPPEHWQETAKRIEEAREEQHTNIIELLIDEKFCSMEFALGGDYTYILPSNIKGLLRVRYDGRDIGTDLVGVDTKVYYRPQQALEIVNRLIKTERETQNATF